MSMYKNKREIGMNEFQERPWKFFYYFQRIIQRTPCNKWTKIKTYLFKMLESYVLVQLCAIADLFCFLYARK
jgi:hypothetical protein